ncbi:hypothetical protein, partial [Klebsiella pneumoniae]|uniref:hypothetical protein n=1 Tax=Klebsiella pneumoniae TaxID=573 RepID=UPI00272F1DBE
VSGTSLIVGNISTSGGNDVINVTGGTIGGQILASTGNDQFNWIGGGVIRGLILMGDGTDTALLQNLTATQLSTTPLIDGGLGTDTL